MIEPLIVVVVVVVVLTVECLRKYVSKKILGSR